MVNYKTIFDNTLAITNIYYLLFYVECLELQNKLDT
jgi:hypothetical protein